MLMPIGLFLLSAVVIVLAGTKLSHYGDRIAEHTGLGRLWIGAVLLAGATSLPEVFTAISAVLLDAPNIAVGDLLGAGLSNMLTWPCSTRCTGRSGSGNKRPWSKRCSPAWR